MHTRTKILFSTLVLLGALAVPELALRLWKGPPRCSPYERLLAASAQGGGTDRSTPMPWDPWLLWGLLPNFEGMNLGVPVKHNALGLRSPQLPTEKAMGERRVLLLGDSTLYGHGVPEGDTIRSRLEVALRTASGNPNVQVISMGVPGYSSLQSLHQYRRLGRPLSPDIVVHGGIWSDAMPDRFEDKVLMEGADGAAQVRHLARSLEERLAPHSALYCNLKGLLSPPELACEAAGPLCDTPASHRAIRFQTVSQPGSPSVATQARVSLADYEGAYDTLAELAQQDGAGMVVLQLAHSRDLGQPVPTPPDAAATAAYRKVQRDFCARTGVACVDMVADFQQSALGFPALFLDPVHPTALGHARMAEQLSAAILADPELSRRLQP